MPTDFAHLPISPETFLDRQTESYRVEHLFDIMQATGEPEFCAAHIRQALATDGADGLTALDGL